MTDEELIEALRGFSSDLETDGHNAEAEIVNNAAARLEALTQPSGKVGDEQVERISRKVMADLFDAEYEGDAESEWHRIEPVVRAALEAAQLPARPVVKALAWKKAATWAQARCSAVGLLQVEMRGDKWDFRIGSAVCASQCETIDQAMAEAEEQRIHDILSALEGEGHE